MAKANVTPSTPVKKTKTNRKRSSPKIQPADKKTRKSRLQYKFTKEFLSQYFHVSQRAASDLLDVSVITVKRCCKREGFKWPYRANKYRLAKEAKERAKREREEKAKQQWTDKAIAFHQLPFDCLKEADNEEIEEVESECLTDTESVEEEQEKQNACVSLVMLMKAVSPCMGVQRKIQL
ncbi:hypothetical protein P3T76_010660 [Phytophthora citrophthora]|uniref:RWP-RK domain-containing protein n=1 Tax=Phytophthora citrophthora TaxID=4793 RepID=A0AAD9LGB8_9STRA|nr:hypothetical protein P3T76_010660 [Phytophthora citrophthora]